MRAVAVMVRGLLAAAAILCAWSPAWAQVQPIYGIEASGASRRTQILDPSSRGWVPTGTLDTTGHVWWPYFGTVAITATTGSGSTAVLANAPQLTDTVRTSQRGAADGFTAWNLDTNCYTTVRTPDASHFGAIGSWCSGSSWAAMYGRGAWTFDAIPNWPGALSIAQGGTGGTTAAAARGSLGIGTAGGLNVTTSNTDTSVNSVATAAFVMAQAGPTLDAVRYGVKCDDTADDTAALQAVWTQLTTIRTRGSLLLPAGNCKFTTGLSTNASNIAIVGQGRGVTNLLFGSATGDVIAIGDGTANPNNITIRDLSIGATTLKTSGAAIAVKNVHVLSISNVNLDYNLYIGFDLDGGSQQFDYNIDNFNINSGTIGIRVGNTSIAQNVYVRNGLIYNTHGYGLQLKNLGGYGFENLDIGSCQVGVQTLPSAPNSVASGYFRSVHADTCSDTGWQIWTAGGSIKQLTCDRCWASNTGTSTHTSGVVIDPKTGQIEGVKFITPEVNNSWLHGFEINGGKHIDIVTPLVCTNSLGGVGVGQGIVFNGGSHASIIGGTSGKCGYFADVGNKQGAGIFIASGFGDYLRVIGTDTTENTTAGIIDNSSGIGHYFDGVAGVVTENNGTATVTNTTSVNIPHGLSWTPAKDQVSLTQMSAFPSGVTNCWVSGTDSTNITVNCNASSATTFYLGWRAKVKNKSSS